MTTKDTNTQVTAIGIMGIGITNTGITSTTRGASTWTTNRITTTTTTTTTDPRWVPEAVAGVPATTVAHGAAVAGDDGAASAAVGVAVAVWAVATSDVRSSRR
jgi:hypothetical protein